MTEKEQAADLADETACSALDACPPWCSCEICEFIDNEIDGPGCCLYHYEHGGSRCGESAGQEFCAKTAFGIDRQSALPGPNHSKGMPGLSW